MCYNNAATYCNGTAVLNVTTARDCCLGDGFWFNDENGQCHQCIGKQMQTMLKCIPYFIACTSIFYATPMYAKCLAASKAETLP